MAIIDEIQIVEPKPFQKVPLSFWIKGKVPESWLGFKDNGRVPIEVFDIEGKIFLGSVVTALIDENNPSVRIIDHEFEFWMPFNEGPIVESAGRIIICFEGILESQIFFLPIVVDGYSQISDNENELQQKHINITTLLAEDHENYRQYKILKEEINKKTVQTIGSSSADQMELSIQINDKSLQTVNSLEILKDIGFEISIIDEATRKKELSVLDAQYADMLGRRGKKLGFSGIELVVYSAVVWIGQWVLGHVSDDVDDAIWEKVKSITKSIFIPAKKTLPIEKTFALRFTLKNNKEAIFVFDLSMSLEEFIIALEEIRNTLPSSSSEQTGRISRKPIIYNFDSTISKWKRTDRLPE